MRYRRSIVPGARYFLTLVTHERARLFEDEANVERWHRAVAKVQRHRPFGIEAEVVLPDHLHLLWSLPDGDADFPTRIRFVKTAFTKDLTTGSCVTAATDSRSRKGEREVWQRRYWEHLIRDDRDFQAHVDYIHFNPVRHQLASSPADWRHSTFRAWVERGAYEA